MKFFTQSFRTVQAHDSIEPIKSRLYIKLFNESGSKRANTGYLEDMVGYMHK